MMFLKGHVSPPPSESQSDEELQKCETHCEQKNYLFDHISEIDSFESKSEKIAKYLHACEDLLSAVDEVQGRLTTILLVNDVISFEF